MHPILFKIGSLNLPTYGFLLVMAILAAVYMVMRLGRREGLDPNRLLDFCTWLVLVGMVGAKVLMVVSDWSYYHQHPGEIFSVSTLLSGGVFYGGFVAAVFFAAWYVHIHHLPYGQVFDVYAPAIAVGQSIGRLGCFAAGDDYGKPTTSWLGVVFTNPLSHNIGGVPLGIPLHPRSFMNRSRRSLFSASSYGAIGRRATTGKFSGCM